MRQVRYAHLLENELLEVIVRLLSTHAVLGFFCIPDQSLRNGVKSRIGSLKAHRPTAWLIEERRITVVGRLLLLT